MTLEEKFCDVITRTDDERKRLKDKLDSDVEQAKHYCEIAKSSEMAFANAKSETYNQQLVIADAAIKQIMKDTPEPEKYDADRVHTLRHILSSGTEATADARYDKMKALCELQAYLKKFPLGVRVAELVREWTGVDDVTVEYTDEFDYVLRVKGTPVMHLYTRPQEIYPNQQSDVVYGLRLSCRNRRLLGNLLPTYSAVSLVYRRFGKLRQVEGQQYVRN